jgi:hypothetical protein
MRLIFFFDESCLLNAFDVGVMSLCVVICLIFAFNVFAFKVFVKCPK